MHRFEKAGLGEAPFRYVGHSHRVGPIRYENKDGTTTEIGAPGQPMGSCDYCGQGIADCFSIRSADGKEFVVGSTCVGRVGESAIAKEVLSEAKRIAAERRAARDAARIAAALEEFEDRRIAFSERPHPREFKDRNGVALTLADYIDWMIENAGRAGQLRVARLIEHRIKDMEGN